MENSHQRKSWLRWAWAAGAAGLVWWAWPVLRPLGAQVLWGYGMALLALPALLRKKLARWQGIALLLIYATFCAIQFFF